MPYATWLIDVLEAAGLTVRPYPGWQNRGQESFTPRGVMMHHTVTAPTTSDAAVDRMLGDIGSSTTQAPLCNWSTNRDGTVTVIAAGTANHGGVGRWNGVSGNRYWFGDEMKNWGTASREPWPQVQLESARRAAAAVLRHINADASWLVGHKEYATPPGRKIDPHTLNMNAERDHVRRLLAESDMPLTPEEEKFVKDMYRSAVVERGSNGTFAGHTVDHLRKHPGGGGLTEAQVKAIINDAQIVAT